MLTPRLVASMVSVVMMFLTAGTVSAQNFPNKPLRIVTGATGGGSDFVARIIAEGISAPLGQPVIVDNRASGVVPALIVSEAAPDGYTLILSGGTLWYIPLLRKAPYDAVRDFSSITLTTMEPMVLVVHPSVAANSVNELIALAKAKPAALSYGSGVIGSSSHLAGELFKSMAGVNILNVPYKGTGQVFGDLLGGQLQMTFGSGGTAAPHIKSGKLRALAVTSSGPSALYPGLPTIAASVPGYEAAGISGFFAPAKTPAAIIKRLNQETVRFLNRTDVKEKFLTAGIEVVGSPPEQLGAAVKSEVARMGKVIRDAGIRAE